MQVYVGDTATVELPHPRGVDYAWGAATATASVTSPAGVTAPAIVQPAYRSWRILFVVDQPGTWIVRWVTTSSATQIATSYVNLEALPAPVPVSLADWRPTLAQVAGRLSARFNGAVPNVATEPTDVQVEAFIDSVQREVAVAVEAPMTAQFIGYARDTVELGVAAYIENSAFPEQNDQLDTSGQAEFFRRRYQEHTATLRGNVRGYITG